MSKYTIPEPGTKEWFKEMGKALKSPSFKLTPSKHKLFKPDEITDLQWERLQSARKYIDDLDLNKSL